MRHLILLLFILFFHHIIIAQKTTRVNGYVRDAQSKELIADAVINAGKNYVISNEVGYFSIELNKSTEIIISRMGYIPLIVDSGLKSDTVIVINLEPKLYDLPELIIEQNIQSLTNKSIGSFSIDVSHLKETPLFLGERDVIKSMQYLPGVSSGMEGSSQLNIRGGSNYQTLYMIDNTPVFIQNHAYGLFSTFNADMIRNAMLYKSGFPAKYNGFLSGVVSIQQKDGNKHFSKGIFSVSPLTTSLMLEGPIIKNRMSYIASVRKSTLDVIFATINRLSNNGGKVNTVPLIGFYDLNLKLSFDINKENKISLFHFSGNDKIYSKLTEKNKEKESEYRSTNGKGWKNNTFSLQYNTILSKKTFLMANLYTSSLTNFNTQDLNFLEEKTSIRKKYDIFSDCRISGIKGNILYNLSPAIEVEAGTHLSQQVFRPQYIQKIENNIKNKYNVTSLSLKTLSFFLSGNIKKGNYNLAIGLNSGIYNNKTKTCFVFEPRVKVEKRINESDQLLLTYDRNAQPINSIYEMNYNTQTDFWIPFQGKSVAVSNQLSLGYKKIFNKINTSLTVEAYYKKTRNMALILDVNSYLENIDNELLGDGKSKGVELIINHNGKRVNGMFSYALSKTTRTFNDITYPYKYDTPHSFSLFLNYKTLNKGNLKTSFSSTLIYKTGIPYFVSDITYPSTGLPIDKSGYFFDTTEITFIPFSPNFRMNNYFRWDLNYTIEKNTKKGKYIWQFSLLNATAHKNPYAIYKNDNSYKAFQLIPLMPSFSYSIHW